MQLTKDADLKNYNSLGISAKCHSLIKINHKNEIPEALAYAEHNHLPWFVIGGGSNIVLVEDFIGVVLLINIRGIKRELIRGASKSDPNGAVLRADYCVGAGENWHTFVRQTSAEGFGGLENLSLIPGTVGAAPIQNIGAYGVEVCKTLTTVSVYDTLRREFNLLEAKDCEFGYRSSIFKKTPHRYIVHQVSFTLTRSAELELGYKPLAEQCNGRTDLSYLCVSNMVCQIRKARLPDPSVLPNAGSFFKNPVITPQEFAAVLKRFPDVVHYIIGNEVKLAAGWLIEHTGWKGYRNDRVGVHAEQALVLINHNHGSGYDVLDLANEVQQSILQKFGVALEIEPVTVSPCDE